MTFCSSGVILILAVQHESNVWPTKTIQTVFDLCLNGSMSPWEYERNVTFRWSMVRLHYYASIKVQDPPDSASATKIRNFPASTPLFLPVKTSPKPLPIAASACTTNRSFSASSQPNSGAPSARPCSSDGHIPNHIPRKRSFLRYVLVDYARSATLIQSMFKNNLWAANQLKGSNYWRPCVLGPSIQPRHIIDIQDTGNPEAGNARISSMPCICIRVLPFIFRRSSSRNHTSPSCTSARKSSATRKKAAYVFEPVGPAGSPVRSPHYARIRKMPRRQKKGGLRVCAENCGLRTFFHLRQRTEWGGAIIFRIIQSESLLQAAWDILSFGLVPA